ncbi:MAG: hypothetical protein Q4G24_10620 [Paracoccus sp. (in: a-proteobacteria)]|uniref:hypothetical protein n=1 Tax=Paracoccus sp. TaxID=267 RepID=UPI0026E085F9|nr:hypothetical protein [Paracoccus sp. (in: a-proteobacteria)]MDO5621911.1 hypothetical protein [Paracoccus sp. (in: a-proteobacteria)]
MILTLEEFWGRICVRRMDLFAPVSAVSSQTAGGQVIRARSFGADLWKADVQLYGNRAAQARAVRALLMLAQQPGTVIEVSDRNYRGYDRVVTVASKASDNRRVVLAGLDRGFVFAPGDMVSIGHSLHAVTAADPANAAGQCTVWLMPHLPPSVVVGAVVEVRRPKMLAVVDQIKPAQFTRVLAGESSFAITQVHL